MGKVSRKSASRSQQPAPRRRGRASVVAPKSPWWLSAGSEVCIFCHQEYAYGTGYRCVGCDTAVCTFCIVERTKELFCPEC
jgi:hypothetical protein